RARFYNPRPLAPSLCLILRPRPPRVALFPYTTLFRSPGRRGVGSGTDRIQGQDRPRPAVDPALGRPGRDRRRAAAAFRPVVVAADRKSTRLNSSHGSISYAVF